MLNSLRFNHHLKAVNSADYVSDVKSSYCLPSGPRRVNHASVSIGDYIYSFGGYCSGEDYRLSRPMDVHVLNVLNLRWSLLPTRKDKKYPNVPFQRYGECLLKFTSSASRSTKRKTSPA